MDSHGHKVAQESEVWLGIALDELRDSDCLLTETPPSPPLRIQPTGHHHPMDSSIRHVLECEDSGPWRGIIHPEADPLEGLNPENNSSPLQIPASVLSGQSKETDVDAEEWQGIAFLRTLTPVLPATGGESLRGTFPPPPHAFVPVRD